VTALPLDGVRVLDLTRLLPGNYCTWLLSALGAEVIKVEDPGAGDYMRDFGTQVDGMGATHQVVNRGKASIVVDLKSPAGVDLFLDLVATADVVVESFRPGVLDRLGLGWERLRGIRPSLVLMSISGFGASGPLSATAGHDINYMAFAGVLNRLGDGTTPPMVPAVPFADLIGGGLVPALGTVAMVLRAQRTGEGGRVESSLAEAVALLPSLVLCDRLAGATIAPTGQDAYDGARAWYRTYALADRGYVAVGAVEERFYANLCTIVGRPDLIAAQHDPDRQDEIADVLRSEFAGLTRAQAEAKYADTDTCVVLVNDFDDMIGSAHATERGLIRTDPTLPLPVPVAPLVVDGTRLPERGPAPRQGEHTEAVLHAAGIEEVRIKDLLRDGVVAQRG
jgi:alpha-methylacyl-CoA racemase